IYISDMLHYNTVGQVDPGTGLLNMADPEQRAAFQRSVVDAHQLYGGRPLTRLTLTDKQRFEVWKIDVPRCDDERLGLETTPDWVRLKSELAALWPPVFRQLGAETHWNISDLTTLR